MISGHGSNLQAVLDAIEQRRLEVEIPLVVSNRRAAYGLERAAHAGVPTHYAPLRPYTRAGGEGREAYDRALAAVLRAVRPDAILLAGFMHVLSEAFLQSVGVPVINLHPALPGQLPGVKAIERAWEQACAGQRHETGVMVHEVVPEIDAGPVLGIATVAIEISKGFDAFKQAMHRAEHGLLIDVLSRYKTPSLSSLETT